MIAGLLRGGGWCSAEHRVPNVRVIRRYGKLDGPMTVIVKPGVNHHPHSLKDPTRIVSFVLSAAKGVPLPVIENRP